MSTDQADRPNDPREQQVQTVVEEFVAQLQAGGQPDRDEFVLAHESLAGALESRLEAAELLHRLAAGDPAPPPLPPRPETIGRYRIDGTLGAGAFAVVYQAYDPKFQRAVALKVLRCDGSDAGKRSDRDARIVARLRHPNIVPLHDTGDADGLRYLDMELVRGPDLEKALKRRDDQRLPPAEAAELVRKIAAGLDYAHQAGVVHRDVKTTNILIDEHGEPQLTDFGLARGSESPSLTVAGQLIGTPAFMSPEQAAGRGHEADARSDLYSLGVVLFRLLTGRLPFADDGSIAALLGQIISHDPPRPCDLVPDLPRDLQTICLKAMEKAPADRFQSAGAFAEELRRWRTGDPLTIRPPTRLERLRRWAKRHRAVARVLTGAAVALLAVTAASGWTVWVQREKRFEARTQAETATQRERLEAERRAEVEAWNVVAAARLRLAMPTGGRRRETHALLREAADLSRQLSPGANRDYLELGIRSVFATSLSVPELDVDEGGEEFPKVFYAAWPATMHPSGASLVVGTPDGPVRWVRGQPLRVPPGLNPRDDRPVLAYSPDGQHLLFAPYGGGLQVWDQAVTAPIAELEPPGSPRVVALGFDPSMATVWALRKDGLVKSWSLPNRRPMDSWKVELADGKPPAAARFNALATEVAVGDAHGRVRLFRRGEEKFYRELNSGRFEVTALGWSADGRLLAVGADDGSVQLWHSDGRPSHRFAAFGNGPGVIQFTPDGQWLLVGGRSSGLKVWDVGSGIPLLTGQYLPWALTPDGRRFAGSDERTVAFCDLRMPVAILDLGGHQSTVDRLVWSADGRHLVTVDSRFEARVWDVERGVAVSAINVPHGSYYAPNSAAALSPDGSLLAFASGGSEAQALLADARTGAVLRRWELPGGFERMAYVKDRFLLAREELVEADSRARQTVVRELGSDSSPLENARVIRPAVEGEEGFFTSDISRDGRFYWWVGPRQPPQNLRMEVRDLATGRLVKAVGTPQKEVPTTWDGSLAPDGRTMWVWTGHDWIVHDLEDERPPYTSPLPPTTWMPGASWEMSFDRSKIVRASYNAALVRLTRGGPVWLELIGPNFNGVSRGTFSPDGRRAAFGTSTGVVTVIDLPLLRRQVEEFERSLQFDSPQRP